MTTTYLKTTIRNATLAAAVLITAAAGATAQAQAADALVDKLVQKGYLTVQEARELRAESDKDFNRAFKAKTGMPDWVTAMKFGGDLRLRMDSIRVDDASVADRNRFRFRARLGPVFTLKDDWEVGVIFTSSDPDARDVGTLGKAGDPISQNASFKDNAGKKFVFFDKVYAKWTALNAPDWQLVSTLGKMENPFRFPGTMLFDKDYTPEGLALDVTHRLTTNQTVKLTLGAFVLDEIPNSTDDPLLVATQLRWDARWSPQWSSSLGGAILAITGTKNLITANVPDVGAGNTRDGAGNLRVNFRTVELDASLTRTFERVPLYPGTFPVTISADYLRNLATSRDNAGWSAGLQLGKADKKNTWELNYRYTRLEGDAWFEELAESDFGAFYGASLNGSGTGYISGTNVRGHWFKGTWAAASSLNLSVAYFLTDLIHTPAGFAESGSGRLFVEAVWKF